MFADDTTLSSFGKNIDTIKQKIQEDLSTITEWLKFNRLVINLSKTHVMHFPTTNRKLELTKNDHIMFNHEKINFVESTKLLGVVIDQRLKFNEHIKNVCKKVNSTILLVNSNHLFPTKFRTTLFKLFIIPNYDYCGSLFMKLHNKKDIEKIDKNFKKSIRRLLKINLFEKSLADQYKSLLNFNILPYLYRSFYHYCTFLFNLESNENIEFSKKFIKNDRPSNSLYYKETGSGSNFNKYSLILVGTKLLNYFYKLNSKLEKDKKFFFGSNCKFKNFLKHNISKLYTDTLYITYSGNNIN